jgi:hypothetical protein
LEETVAAPVWNTENTVVGIRYADHAKPSIRISWHFTDKRLSLGRYSSLAPCPAHSPFSDLPICHITVQRPSDVTFPLSMTSLSSQLLSARVDTVMPTETRPFITAIVTSHHNKLKWVLHLVPMETT